MTICVGSISRNDDGREQYAVVSSDRMATLSLPSIEWEQNLPKTTKISENCVVSTAGSAIAFSSILRMAQPEIDKKGDVDIATAVEILRKSYERVRKKKLEEEITSKIGLSLAEFYSNQGSISPQIVGKVFDAMAKYDYNLELLVAGVDAEGPHIYRISNPGRADCFDSIGYHAIGSGQLHALSTFIANDFDPYLDLDHIAAMTYEAKKRSEKAQGVGQESDLYIICNTKVVKVPDKVIERLYDIHKKILEMEKNTVEEIQKEIEKLKMEEMEKMA